MELTPNELLEITAHLIKYVESLGIKNIKFQPEDSYYQKIWHEDRDILKTPPIALGYIDEDLAALKRLINNKEEAPTAYDLERLGAILTTLGAIVAKK